MQQRLSVSVAPDGVGYPLPDAPGTDAEHDRLRDWAVAERPVVVIQGVGFVGSAVAVAVASSLSSSEPRYSVVGVDLPTVESYWRIARANEGVPPLPSDDKDLAEAHRMSVLGRGNLTFTWLPEAYELADIVVVDINLDVAKRQDGDYDIDLSPYRAAIRDVGRHMRPDALVLVESTVPPGTCSRLVEPTLREELQARGVSEPQPLVGHAYERITPGPNYLGSVNQFHRVFAGNTAAAAARTRAFLESFVDTANFPLSELPDTTSSEMAKVLENTYRATNIALITEWSELAEAAGVDLYRILEAIRMRPTHANIMGPGFGVGGYCLPKDSLLADWAARTHFGLTSGLPQSVRAVSINDAMPDHAFHHLRRMLGSIEGRRIAVLGVSYLAGVADTRGSPTARFVDLVEAEGGSTVVCDPIATRWEERPGVAIVADPFAVDPPVDAIVLAVAHRHFRELDPVRLVAHFSTSMTIVDGWNLLGQERANALMQAGWQVQVIGRGDLEPAGASE